MDGVCTNFIEECLKANNFDPNIEIPKWKKNHAGEFNATKVLDISNSVFWKNIEKQGEEFWSKMEPYIWFEDLYTKLSNVGKVYFLTSPSHSPFSLSGKLIWLQSQFNKNFKDYVITPNKELLAKENTYLIDDYPQNIEKFNSAGGVGILFPQFWNSKTDVENKIDYILSKL